MAELDKHKFVTDMMNFASSAEQPDQIINNILQYICENLNSDRAYIFENNFDGTFSNTYEWCRDGVSAEKGNLQNVLFDGLLDVWYHEYQKSHNIIIYDMEEYRATSEPMYHLLKTQNIERLVTGPIYIDGKYAGFYGVDNPPREIMDNISDLIDTMEFVIVMMLRIRNYSRKLEEIAMYDQLTKCRNRSALGWAYRQKYDTNKSLGVVMCDLNGLKRTNDSFGHEAGDKYIVKAANILLSLFGKESVYRLGGDEFLAVLPEWKEDDILSRISLAKKESTEYNVSFSLGYAFRSKADEPFEKIAKEADRKMYIDKQNYYNLMVTYKKHRLKP